MKTSTEPARELPPFIRTWKRFYLIIIGWTLILIVLFWMMTRYFS